MARGWFSRGLLARIQVSLFFLFLYQGFIFVEVAVHAGQFQGLHAHDLVLGSALFTGDHIALFNFIEFNV